MWRLASLVALTCLLADACGGGRSTTSPSPSPAPTPAPAPAPTPPGLPLEVAIAGDPESAQGATWTGRGTVDGTAVDLEGVLLKPAGGGPFPAVIISHGNGGSARQFSLDMGREMRSWGLVAIATNYTHAGGVPIGAPGTAAEPGASPANVVRAHATLAILARLGYVDLARVAAHGHSMGAFVTTAFVAAHGAEIRVASHTAGGVRPDSVAVAAAAAPTEAQAALIRTPYQWHHGDADVVVPLGMDQRFEAALGPGTMHEGHAYPGVDHAGIAQHPAMLARVRAWYAAHGLF